MFKGGSPIYKPYEFRVPENCDLSNNVVEYKL